MIVRPVRSSDLPALIESGPQHRHRPDHLAGQRRAPDRTGSAGLKKPSVAKPGVVMPTTCSCSKTTKAEVVGISAIAGAVGLREPWYNFRVGLTVSASQELNIYREIPTLFLANDLTGNSELCSLFLQRRLPHRPQRPHAGQGAHAVYRRVPAAVRQQDHCRDARHVRRSRAARRSGKAWAGTSSRWSSARPTT